MSKRFGLIGEKLAYSRSPQIHAEIFKQIRTMNVHDKVQNTESDVNIQRDECGGFQATYELLELKKEAFQSTQIEKTLNTLKAFDGFNVTIPYKEEILNYLDEVQDKARRIGAVNTVSVNPLNGHFVGFNTDYDGFRATLTQYGRDQIKRAIVLGTGGAAKMVVVALEDLGVCDIYVVSRNPLSAQNQFPNCRCIGYDCLNSGEVGAELLVNCTPMGQSVDADSNWISDAALMAQSFIFDLNYTPELTPLLERGAALNIDGCNGLYMLVMQAVKAESIWLSDCLPETADSLKMAEEILTALCYNVTK